jgi:hypothetical protein
MPVLWWSLGLFIIGLLEFCIDQYQKIVLSRLRFWPTVIFQWLNQIFTFLVNVYVFGTIMDFWTKFRSGVYDAATLYPYLAYIHGCVAGTGIALLVYRNRKQKQSREKAIKLLEKARTKKKKLSEVQADINIETLFDDVDIEDMKEELKERTIADAKKRISDKIEKAFQGNDDARKTSDDKVQNQEGNSETPPPSTAGGTSQAS